MKIDLHRVLMAVCLTFCVSLMALPAKAQDSATEKTHKRSLVLEPVVVTAQKREENVQDVPVSMDVFTGTDVEDAGINGLSDLTLYSPNVYAKQSINQNMIIMRGLSSHNVILNTPAGLFVDDICYPMTFMQNPALFDIERVEVLRGPQGVLYGNNTESGAIRIITRKPGNTVEGKAFIEPGMYNSDEKNSWLYNVGASLRGPLVEDTLYMGGAFLVTGTPGYMTNVYNDDDEAAKKKSVDGQVKLRWTPTSRWDVSLLVNGSRKDSGYGYTHYITGPNATDPYKINWDGANKWVDTNNGQAITASHSAKWADITSITTRNDFVTDFKNDGEFGPLPFPDQEFRFQDETYSQEIRFSSPEEEGPLEWLGGAFFSHSDNMAKAAFFGQLRKTYYDSTNYAAFGQLAYKFFDRLKVTAGLRLDHYEADGRQYLVSSGLDYSKKISHDDILPKLALAYDLSDDVMTYASVSKGSLAGGYNYAFATNADSLTFGPEKTWNYELGIKSEWLKKTLQINVTGFYISIKDKQVEEWMGGPANRSITNAAKASSRGLEMQINYRPATGWLLFGNGGYTDAKIDKWVSDEVGGGTYDYAGKTLPYAPEYTFNLGGEYMHDTGWFGRLDLLGVGNFYTDAKNTSKVDSYEVVNLRVGRRMESWDFSIWCKNLMGREYYIDKGVYIGGDQTAIDGAPRSIGMNVTYRF